MTDGTHNSASQGLIRDLFASASELPSESRAAWVERHAQGNAHVVNEVMRLLRASGVSGGAFLVEPAWKRERPVLEEGMMIGPYRVLKEIGSGGMGVVYLTMRSDEAYRRLAALKIIRPELRTDPLLNRFLQEREILGRLDHPNIARIIDGGTTATGLPYFVMDYIDGQPIDQFCMNRRATIQERLNLFRQMCDAVDYLHRNDVLHRDLKPANLLVTESGQVKLLDFGISKPGGQFSRTLTTGQPMATTCYASPEQLNSKKVTAASDVYSLGVVLYELLTGVRPLKLDGLSLSEALNTVTTQNPPKPSTQPLLPQDADPGRVFAGLRPQLAGDLDCILMMALRKEPERRYETAAEFAADIERFQNGRPVIARGDGVAYKLGRSVRRNRIRIAVVSIVFVSLGFGGAAYYEVMKERAVTAAVVAEVKEFQDGLAKAQAEHKAVVPEQLQHNLNRITEDYTTKTPAIVGSKLAPRGMTKDMVQQSLSYFAAAHMAAGDNPETLAALGRAYLAVAQTQWNPDGASLNDPAGAKETCVDALQALSASVHLKTDPQVQQVALRISAFLDRNPASRRQDMQ